MLFTVEVSIALKKRTYRSLNIKAILKRETYLPSIEGAQYVIVALNSLEVSFQYRPPSVLRVPVRPREIFWGFSAL